MTTSMMALANEGLFELTRRPSLTRAVSLSFAETTEEPGCSQVKRPKFGLDLVIFEQISPDYNLIPRWLCANYETARVYKRRRVSSNSPSLARTVEEVMSKETDET